jgi:hypothetical protein
MRQFGTSALLAVSLAFTCAPAIAGGDTSSVEGAKVYFVNVKDGDVVTNPVTLNFGLTGMGVSPAGIQGAKGTGHHHLLINATLSGDALGLPIPADENHRHFGGGQTEVILTLPKGRHTIQLLLGDWKHTPHTAPVMSKAITITVK